MFLESIGDNKVNYNHVNDLDFNQDDHEYQKCHPSIFCKETGVLVDFLDLNPHNTITQKLNCPPSQYELVLY